MEFMQSLEDCEISTLNHSSSNRTNLKNLEVEEVRITPACIVFENAYEGKSFSQVFVIQNCGKKCARIRIGNPSSSSIQCKPLTEEVLLSPGMRIVRNVKYIYSTTLPLKEAFLTIYINNTEVTYWFYISRTEALLEIEPKLVDFGDIDAVNHVTTRTFLINNRGLKGTHFAIDSGHNNLDIIVDPLKAFIPAKSTVPVNIELIGCKEGEFLEEIWVKSPSPQRVIIKGNFVAPHLKPGKFDNNFDLTLTDFPLTYYGAASTKTVLIKNVSSCHSMFCVMAEIKGTIMSLEQAKTIDNNFKDFIISPTDGRIAASKGTLINITFSPVKLQQKQKTYSACFLKVIKMDCRDITPQDKIFAQMTRASQHSLAYSSSFGTSSTERGNSSLLLNSNSPSSVSSVLSIPNTFSFEHAIRLCLHGIKEDANVTFTPTDILLSDLVLNQTYQRVLLVANNSQQLPIKVKYLKVAYIDVKPSEFELEPNQKLEVAVSIRSDKLDRVEKKMRFELLAKDSPAEQNCVRKVGACSVNVSFETTTVLRKAKTLQCEKIDVLEHDKPYKLSEAQLNTKIKNDKYYLDYIRSLQKSPSSGDVEIEDYPVTNTKLLKLCKCRPKTTPAKTVTYISPLSPSQLFNVKITPKTLYLQKVAAESTITDFLTVENLNSFHVEVFVSPSKSCIIFEKNQRYTINKNEKKKIYFTFSPSDAGRYYVNINILLNNSALYEVTALAHVVPKTLLLESESIEFDEEEGEYKFLKVINKLNTDTIFEWSVPSGNFNIFPVDGVVRAESCLLSVLTYTLNPAEQNCAELVLISQSGHKTVLTVSSRKSARSVAFNVNEIDVGAIPLNIPTKKKIYMKNLTKFKTLFTVLRVSIPGISVEPEKGALQGLSTQVFTVTIALKAVVKFATKINFLINEEDSRSVPICGEVEYPNFTLTPNILNFRKILANSWDCSNFKMTNVSKCPLTISFFMDEYPEFNISCDEMNLFPMRDVQLEPHQAKTLFLHFHPEYVSTSTFLLPLVVNGVIGPPTLTNSDSKTTMFFLAPGRQHFSSVDDLHIISIPKQVPTITVIASSSTNPLEFSWLTTSLFFYGANNPNNSRKTLLEISNTGAEEVAVCIRLDDLKFPFSLAPSQFTGNQIEVYEVSYKITLLPKEKVSLEAKFSPTQLGKYIVRLPIFIRHFSNDDIFNYLTLKGKYETPSMVPSSAYCHFEPVPLGMPNRKMMTIYLKNHFSNCDIKMDENEIDVTFNREIDLVQVYLTWKYNHISCFKSELRFSCSCKSSCTVTVTGVSENCLLTTHALSHFLMQNSATIRSSISFASRPAGIASTINTNTSSFPLFPDDNDNTKYAIYMRRLKQTLEYWLFSQGFYMKQYVTIPEGLADFCTTDHSIKNSKLNKSAFNTNPPLLELLENLVGKSVRNLTASFPKVLDETQWLLYICDTYNNILDYLNKNNVFLPHVEIKYLLTYDQYMAWEKFNKVSEKIKSRNEFNRISTQCWIDLVLQICKSLYLFQLVTAVTEIKKPKARMSKKLSRYSFSTLISHSEETLKDVYETGFYGCAEETLLKWLAEMYEKEKKALWAVPEDKEVMYFDVDLRDGLVLGAVTAHYCPYIASEIKAMIPKPVRPEDKLHNLCVLVKVWKMLKLSYVLSPLTLLHSGMVEMLLVVTYLYTILPFYQPKQELVIEAGLTQTNSSSLELQNLGNHIIKYQLVFYNNKHSVFNVEKSEICVRPKKSQMVTIWYHAKNLGKTIATLLFCGESPGCKYGKSLVVTLKGIPDVTYASQTIPVKQEMYTPCMISANIQSPFKVKADYFIYFSFSPADIDKKSIFPLTELLHHIRVQSVHVPIPFEFDDQGSCLYQMIGCHNIKGPRNYWYYFTNPEIGDFAVRFIINDLITDRSYEKIEVLLPENYNNLKCKCGRKPKINNKCPKIVNVKIPKMNNLLWNAIKTMLLKHVSDNSLEFWSKILYSSTGTRLIKLLFNSEVHPLHQDVPDDKIYTITVESKALVTVNKVKIEDIISDGFIEIPIHLVKDVKVAKMRWDTEEQFEFRLYKLLFKNVV